MRRVMWNGSVRSLPLWEQLRASARAGCEALSVTPFGYNRWLAEGLTSREVLSMAADSGVKVFHLDPLIRWVEPWRPDLPESDFPYAALSYTEAEFFSFAEALEVESFTAWGAFPAGAIGFDQLVEAFGGLCERAASHGLCCWLEFLPMYGVASLRAAWCILEAVGAPNSGLVLDLWHYFRGRPDDDLLRRIPGHRIAAVQISDATALAPPGIPLGRDGQTSRRLPGEGEFPIADTLRVLRETGGLGTVGLEIFSTRFDAMTAEEIGSLCRASLDGLLLT